MQTDVIDIPLLIRLIETNPEWRALLRRVVLPEELLELPELFRRLSDHIEALTESHRRSEERLDRLEATVQELVEAQKRTDEAIKALTEAQKRAEERLGRVEERLDRLEAIVQELAEAQKRTEERLDRLEATVQELVEAQKRTDEAIKALTEAQKRSEERLGRVEERVDRLEEAQLRTEEAVRALAEAQRRTDEKVDELGQKVDHLAEKVDNLQRTIGATMEEEAEDWVCYLLEEKGYQILEAPVQVRMDGEVDVAIPAARDGQVIWAVVEAKTRLSWREMEDWANRMRSEGFRRRLTRHGVPGPYLVYIYGLRVDAACDRAARRFGIGLITGRGERVPPGPLLPPVEPEEKN